MDLLAFVEVQLLMCWQCIQVISRFNRRNSYMFHSVVILCMCECVHFAAKTMVCNKCQSSMIIQCTSLFISVCSVCIFLSLGFGGVHIMYVCFFSGYKSCF